MRRDGKDIPRDEIRAGLEKITGKKPSEIEVAQMIGSLTLDDRICEGPGLGLKCHERLRRSEARCCEACWKTREATGMTRLEDFEDGTLKRAQREVGSLVITFDPKVVPVALVNDLVSALDKIYQTCGGEGSLTVERKSVKP